MSTEKTAPNSDHPLAKTSRMLFAVPETCHEWFLNKAEVRDWRSHSRGSHSRGRVPLAPLTAVARSHCQALSREAIGVQGSKRYAGPLAPGAGGAHQALPASQIGQADRSNALFEFFALKHWYVLLRYNAVQSNNNKNMVRTIACGHRYSRQGSF